VPPPPTPQLLRQCLVRQQCHTAALEPTMHHWARLAHLVVDPHC
jgi:hypothetical protein